MKAVLRHRCFPDDVRAVSPLAERNSDAPSHPHKPRPVRGDRGDGAPVFVLEPDMRREEAE